MGFSRWRKGLRLGEKGLVSRYQCMAPGFGDTVRGMTQWPLLFDREYTGFDGCTCSETISDRAITGN